LARLHFSFNLIPSADILRAKSGCYCGLVVCPVSPNETGPSSLRNGSQPYEIPLATADCLARMNAGNESSKTKKAKYTSVPDKPLK
jgi:hypothetical protein